MSATLTWQNSALTTKTGTAVGNIMTDLKTNIDSMSGDASYPWEVAASNLGSTPYYVYCRPKSGAAGRILFISWSSAPAGNNAAILQQAPSTSAMYVAYFPAGTAASPSNLTASSGTISGDDTDAVKCSVGVAISTIYGANFQLNTFACGDGIVLLLGNPAAATQYWMGAGKLVVDLNDDEHGCVWASTSPVNSALASAVFTWNATAPLAGTTSTPCVRANYPATDYVYFQAFSAGGSWYLQTPGGAVDPLLNTATAQAYFHPFRLIGNLKGTAMTLKFRQIAWGPGSTSDFRLFNTTGPVKAAVQMNNYTSGSNGSPYATNYKV